MGDKKVWQVTYEVKIEHRAFLVAESKEEAEKLMKRIPGYSWEESGFYKSQMEVLPFFPEEDMESAYVENCLESGEAYPANIQQWSSKNCEEED